MVGIATIKWVSTSRSTPTGCSPLPTWSPAGETIHRALEFFQTAGFALKESVEQFGRKKCRIEADKHAAGRAFALQE